MGLTGRALSSQPDFLERPDFVINSEYNLDDDPLVTESDIGDVEDFIQSYPNLTKEYIPIAVIGEGTFSTVFKAIDVHHWSRDNSRWQEFSRQDPEDPSKIFSYFSRMSNIVQTRATKRALMSPLNQAIKNFVLSQYFGIDELTAQDEQSALEPEHKVDLEELKARFARFPPQCVAIKRINSTSGPKRITEEINFLIRVGGSSHVVPLICGHRFEDQVLMIFPYFRGEDFREFMLSASPTDIADYMRLLLEALEHLHRNKLIHRDVKPSNFLFARRTATEPARAVLVDFGLAQYEDKNVATASIKTVRTFTAKKQECIARLRTTLSKYPPGLIINDPRQQMRASRAGTRGFRAPEVLFKIPHQSTLIDMWSAGVILLTLMTKRYPFFQSNDDTDAIVEIAALFGTEDLERAAKAYHRTWKTNIGSVPDKNLGLRNVVRRLAPEVFAKMPDEAFDLLENILKLVVTERFSATQALSHPFLKGRSRS